MRKFGYVIYDAATEAYTDPAWQESDMMCGRALRDACRQPGMLRDYPEQFAVFKVAKYSQETGVVELIDKQLVFADLRQFVEQRALPIGPDLHEDNDHEGL